MKSASSHALIVSQLTDVKEVRVNLYLEVLYKERVTKIDCSLRDLFVEFVFTLTAEKLVGFPANV